MSLSAWAEGSTAPITCWLDGFHIRVVSPSSLPLTAEQARALSARLLDLADQAERADLHGPAVDRLNDWVARRAGRTCQDCDNHDQPCICQIAERPYLSREQVLREVDVRR